MPNKTQHPFKDAMVGIVVRNHLAAKLVSDHGFSRAEARAAVHELSDDVIEQAATKTFASAIPQAGGGIWDFIQSLLASPLFAQLITLLLSLFAAPAPAAGTPPAPVDAAPPPA